MRTLQLLMLALLATAARADTVSIVDIFGPAINTSFADDNGFALFGENTTLVYDSSAYPYSYAGAVYGQPKFWSVTTGPFVRSKGNSWTYHSGTIEISSPFTYSVVPNGFATCEAAGLITGGPLPGSCLVANAGTAGHIVGDVTFSLQTFAVPPDNLVPALFDLSGRVVFDIGSDLAVALGVSTGPYFGTLHANGAYLLTEGALNSFLENHVLAEVDPSRSYSTQTYSMTLYGTTVPEPSTLLLLSTGLFFFVRRLRESYSKRNCSHATSGESSTGAIKN